MIRRSTLVGVGSNVLSRTKVLRCVVLFSRVPLEPTDRPVNYGVASVQLRKGRSNGVFLR
jgi:hypothetical protein